VGGKSTATFEDKTILQLDGTASVRRDNPAVYAASAQRPTANLNTLGSERVNEFETGGVRV